MCLSTEEVEIILRENNLKKDIYKLIKSSEIIKELAFQEGNILNRTTIIKILSKLKRVYTVPERTTISLFLKYTVDILNLFEEVTIFDEKDGITVTRYVAKYIQVSPYEIALSLLSQSFLSHYSSLYLHDLTINNPKDIYINREQSIKPLNKENAKLTQGRVDYAFSKPMRSTKSIYNFSYSNNFYRVHILNSKNTNKTGIIYLKPIGFSKKVRITNLERTLIDVIIRPKYSGGTSEIFDAYGKAKDKFNIKKLVEYLNKFNYIYPYIKSLLFYVKYNSYKEKDILYIRSFLEKNTHKNIFFYLDYQISNKVFEKDIGVYYPKELKEFMSSNLDS